MTLPPLPDLLGYLAALLTTASFLPQTLLTLRTRDVSGISLAMYSTFTLGVALWLVYGITIGAWPIIVANGVTLALAATILVTKLRVERARPAGSATAVTGAGQGKREPGVAARRPGWPSPRVPRFLRTDCAWRA